MEVSCRARLLIEQDQGAVVFHIYATYRLESMDILHRDEILDLVLVHFRVKNLQSECACNLAQALNFTDSRQLDVDEADLVHDDHEFRVRAEERPLQDDRSKGKPSLLLK